MTARRVELAGAPAMSAGDAGGGRLVVDVDDAVMLVGTPATLAAVGHTLLSLVASHRAATGPRWALDAAALLGGLGEAPGGRAAGPAP